MKYTVLLKVETYIKNQSNNSSETSWNWMKYTIKLKVDKIDKLNKT